MRYATSIILACTLFIGEIHTFWEKPVEWREIDGVKVLYEQSQGVWQVAHRENWILHNYMPMTIQWNVKLALDNLIYAMLMVAMLFFGKYRNRINKISVGIFLVYGIVDIGLYFWNFKTVDYHIVYFCMAVTWAIAFVYGQRIVRFFKAIKRRLIG